MAYNALYNFISPVTGRLPCPLDYILVGDEQNIANPSSVLIDIKQDISTLLAAPFILKEPIEKLPNAQFLTALAPGAIVKTSAAGDGLLESVLINLDHVLMGGVNNEPESRARIGLGNLPLLDSKKLWSGDADGIAQVITTIDVLNLPNLAPSNFWIGDENNRPVAQSVINIDNLPNLTTNMVWRGDTDGRPTEIELNYAPPDATYIITQPNAALGNAQVLSELGLGMVKLIADGSFALAIADEDYATKETLEQLRNEAEDFKNQAANSAEQASASAAEASASSIEAIASAAEATAASITATGAATTATGAAATATAAALGAGVSAASASSSASGANDSAEQSLQYLTQLLNSNINLAGDVLGAGLLKDTIMLSFKANPVFTGTGSMTIPVGTTAERPGNPVIGMVRLNIDL